MPPGALLSQEFATQLTFLSQQLNRIVGVLLNRKGRVEHVMIGDVFRLYLPDIGRVRAGSGRFRGLRLVRTDIQGAGLGAEDRADLSKLRLDAVVSVEVGAAGYPGDIRWGHLIPENPDGDLWQKHRAPAISKIELDFEVFIAELEAEFQRKADTLVSTGGEPAILVYAVTPGVRPSDVAVPEMLELARTAGVEIRDVIIQNRHKPDPKYVIGRGKLEELVLRALQLDAELIIFGCDLAPRQMRAITDAAELRIIDRTQLILDIFAQHAHTKDGKLQVELAQLKYTLPRLIAQNTGMSRLTGGIGGRGPGETKLEMGRRRARDRIQKLKGNLKRLTSQRETRRHRRRSHSVPIVSIVGYTNAGKSTLLNALTNAEVLSEDKLFATLETTSRRLRFPQEREVVLTDTVGFIHDLPKDLVAAFKATLEELADADLLIHLVDVSTEGYEDRMEAVEKILRDLELDNKPQLLVFNKADMLPEGEAVVRAVAHKALVVSALQPETAKPLLDEIDSRLFFQNMRADRTLAPA